MLEKKIKYFTHINEFFETTGFEKRTDLHNFFIFRFDELPNEKALKMPPYQKNFYQVSLILNADNAEIGINEQENRSLSNTLYFLSPDHIFWWQRSLGTTGYIVYFKADFFSFFKGDFKSHFSFFDLSHSNFLELENKTAKELSNDFDKLHWEYYSTSDYRVQILQSLLLSLLFKCKSFQEEKKLEHSVSSKKQDLVYKFQNLVANCFIKHKHVSQYADQLFVSPNYLNQVVKKVTGRTAKQIIADKIILEAKKQLQYTPDDIAQIAHNMGFDEPTHFIRFFKRESSLTPKEFRNKPM